MSTPHAEGQRPTYDRAFLLSDGKRNQVMELWEVQQFGIDSFADPEYVCIYGMPPTEWYRRGIRLLARTTLEAVRDRLGDLIGQDVARSSTLSLPLRLSRSSTRSPGPATACIGSCAMCGTPRGSGSRSSRRSST